MIPEIFIEQWRKNAPWQNLAMIEQDFLISKILIDLYNNPEIASALVFRGGTALNKIYINPPARYSEDIDLVQINAEPIGRIMNAIRDCLAWLGEPKRKITERSAKLIYRYEAIDRTPAKVKIEINTTEHFQVEPLKFIKHQVDSEWFLGHSMLTTYELDELMATKLKALYQRRKGRDLFDLWLVLDRNLINPPKVLTIFDRYCNHEGIKITRALFEKSLQEKCQHTDFKNDMRPLLTVESSWNFKRAVEMVDEYFISCLPGEPLKLGKR